FPSDSSTANMSTKTDSTPIDADCRSHEPPEEPELDDLLRLTKLVQHLFHVPIAYMALLGPDLTVLTRIGSGSEYWDNVRTYPLAKALAKPIVWPDPGGEPIAGFVCGKVRFVAAVPLRSSDGLELGL